MFNFDTKRTRFTRDTHTQIHVKIRTRTPNSARVCVRVKVITKSTVLKRENDEEIMMMILERFSWSRSFPKSSSSPSPPPSLSRKSGDTERRRRRRSRFFCSPSGSSSLRSSSFHPEKNRKKIDDADDDDHKSALLKADGFGTVSYTHLTLPTILLV